MLTGEQVDRAVSYAAAQGRSKLALLVPDNNSGLNIVKAALMSSVAKDMSLDEIINNADMKLYEGKKSGKNKVM